MLLRKAGNTLFSNSFFIFIIRFFPSLANLLVMVWYSRNLSQEDYGHYISFWTQLLVICPVICFGIHVLLVTYAEGFIIRLLAKVTSVQYFLFVSWSVLLSAVFAVLQYNANGIMPLTSFLFILTYSLTFILESFLIVSKGYGGLTVMSILYSAIFCGIHWYILQHGFSIALFSWLLVLVAARFFIYAGLVVIKVRQYGGSQTEEDTPVEKIRSLWLHLGLYDVLQVLFSYIDKFIISLVLAASLSAVYYNGSQNIPFIPLLLSAAGSAVLMQMAAGKKEDEHSNLIRLMNQSGRALSCIVFPVFFFLFFFRTELMTGLFREKYVDAIPIFMVSILVIPVRAYNFTTVLQRLHKGNIINTGAVIDLLLACALMYPLYLWLGLPGVALSFVITTYLQAAFYLIYSSRLLGVSPLRLIPYVNWLIKLIVFASLFISIHYAADRLLTGKNMLILISGAAVMAITVAISLLAELKSVKNGSN